MLKLKTGSNTGSDILTHDPTRPSQNRWPVIRRPGSISDSTACCIHPDKSSSIFPAHAQNSKDTSFPFYLCHCLVLSVRPSNILCFGFNAPHTWKKTQFCDSYLFSLWWTHLLNQKLMIWGPYRVWLKGWHVNPLLVGSWVTKLHILLERPQSRRTDWSDLLRPACHSGLLAVQRPCPASRV